MWSTSFLANPHQVKAFLNFLGSRKIGTLFLYISNDRLQENPETYRLFVRRAHAGRICVQALDGEPEWVHPGRRSRVAAFLEAVVQFNNTSEAEERFDAVHLDVEPQVLPAWREREQEELVKEYVQLLVWCHERTQRAGILLNADIPTEFNHLDVGSSTLLGATLDSVDEVTVMAYRSRPDEIIAGARPAIEEGRAKNKKVWVGISASPAEFPRVRPGRVARSEVELIIRHVESAFQEEGSFRGVAIHSYTSYQELLKGRPSEFSR